MSRRPDPDKLSPLRHDWNIPRRQLLRPKPALRVMDNTHVFLVCRKITTKWFQNHMSDEHTQYTIKWNCNYNFPIDECTRTLFFSKKANFATMIWQKTEIYLVTQQSENCNSNLIETFHSDSFYVRHQPPHKTSVLWNKNVNLIE